MIETTLSVARRAHPPSVTLSTTSAKRSVAIPLDRVELVIAALQRAVASKTPGCFGSVNVELDDPMTATLPGLKP